MFSTSSPAPLPPPSQHRTKVKVLVCGPVLGQFRHFAEKLTSLQNGKAGPFDICFCVGPFFASHLKEEAEQLLLLGNTKVVDSSDTNGGGRVVNDKQCVHGCGDAADGPGMDDGYCTKTTKAKKDESANKDEQLSRITLPLPVYFVDRGVLPEGIQLVNQVDNSNDHTHPQPSTNHVNDNNEIALENNDKAASMREYCSYATKFAHFLYQLGKQQQQPPPGADNVTTQSINPTPDIISIPIHKTTMNLVVAYLPPHVRYNEKGADRNSSSEMDNLEVKASHPSYLGCDLLLSSEWGQGIASSKTFISADQARIQEKCPGVPLSEMGSYDVAEFAALLRPRYHFAPSTFQLNYEAFASCPYQNVPPSTAAANSTTRISSTAVHVARFIALGNVIDSKGAKLLGKGRKFMHAVGIVPLIELDRHSLLEVPPGTVGNPYTDDAYEKVASSRSFNGKNLRSSATSMNAIGARGAGLSQAQARRMMMEEGDTYGTQQSQQQFRWNVSSGKRKRNPVHDEQAMQEQYALDPTNKCLFVHGLDKDPGDLLNFASLLEAFQHYGCTKVRIPPVRSAAGGKSSYGFVEFGSHEDARNCLKDTSGALEVLGIPLALKWSSGGNASATVSAQPSHGQNNAGGKQKENRKVRLTEAEASNSDTLFVGLSKSVPIDDLPMSLEKIREIAEKNLEKEINADGTDGEKVTANEEPALAVSVRHPDQSKAFGFLSFASHAAASMAIACMTGSPDGGRITLVTADIDPNGLINGASLHWAKGGMKNDPGNEDGHAGNERNKKHHFPKDCRTDCWFCLASPTCEKHMIVEVKDSCYITMPKGPLNEHHTLIVPVEHSSNGAFCGSFASEVNKMKDDMRKYVKTVIGKELFVFERAIQTKGGYHTHVQCVPLSQAETKSLPGVLMSHARQAGFHLKEVTSDLSLKSIVGGGEEAASGYFYAEVPIVSTDNQYMRFTYMTDRGESGDGEKERQKITVPVQFGREAAAAVCGRPEAGEWKACVQDEAAESTLAENFRKSWSEFKSGA